MYAAVWGSMILAADEGHISWLGRVAENIGWAVVFAALFTGPNIQGIKSSARLNALLATGMGLVVAAFFVAATHYIAAHPHPGIGFFTHPVYDPHRWSWPGILSGTSLAVLATTTSA